MSCAGHSPRWHFGMRATMPVFKAVLTEDQRPSRCFWSLVGAAFGIALRIRALLYAGVTFLIVNVLGQLVRFYPDRRLAKAVMLMALGAAITAAMVWFNLKREMS